MMKLIFILLSLSWCLAQTSPSSCPLAPGTYKTGTDLFPVKTYPQLSENFEISYNLSYKIVKNNIINETYVLYHCNTPKPAIPGSRVMFVEIPVDAVGINDRGLITFVERLNERSTIKYLNSLPQTASPCLQVMADKGLLGFGANYTTNLDILFSATANETTGTGIVANQTVVASIYSENTPLSRFEWIYFIAAFYNREDAAQTIASQVDKTYTCNVNNMANVQPKAQIAWIQRNSDGTYSTKDSGWKQELVRNAGAIPLGNGTYRSVYGSQTEMQNALLSADIVIEETAGIRTFQQFLDAYGITNGGPTSPFAFVRGKTVFVTDRTVNEYGVEAWGEVAPAMPGSILTDLIDITFDNYKPGQPTIYFRNIAKVDGYLFLNRSQCTNVSADFVQPDPNLCPVTPFNGATPIPAWDTSAAPNSSVSTITTGTMTATMTGTMTQTMTASITKTATPTTTSQMVVPPPSSGGLSSGAIAGIVIGVLAAAGLVGWGAVAVSKKSRGYQPHDSTGGGETPYSPNQSANKGGKYVPMNDDGIFVPQNSSPLAGQDDVELEPIELEGWK